jgi:hypothetical protein
VKIPTCLIMRHEILILEKDGFRRYFLYIIQVPGLFTSQDCCSDNDAACEAVFVYREQAAKKSMW